MWMVVVTQLRLKLDDDQILDLSRLHVDGSGDAVAIEIDPNHCTRSHIPTCGW